MDGLAEGLSVVAGAVASGAVEGTATVPVVAATATAEGVATGAVTSVAPTVVEAGVNTAAGALVESSATPAGPIAEAGVRTASKAVEGSSPASKGPDLEALAGDKEFKAALEAYENASPEDQIKLGVEFSAMLREKYGINVEDMQEEDSAEIEELNADTDKPPLSDAAKLARVRNALGHDDKVDSDREHPLEPDQDLIAEYTESRKNERNPKVDKTDFYNPDPKYFEFPTMYLKLRDEFVKDGKDLKDKNVQRELLDRYYYRQAQSLMLAGEGKISGHIRASTEFMQARDRAKELMEKSGVQTTDREIDKWALAMYLELADKAKKKKKESLLMMILKGAVAAAIGGGKATVDESKPDLNLKGN